MENRINPTNDKLTIKVSGFGSSVALFNCYQTFRISRSMKVEAPIATILVTVIRAFKLSW